MRIELTEFSDLIDRYTADFVGRKWLAQRIEAQLADPACRFVVVTGDPGVGKTAFMAHLAATHPDWLRYFLRRDSRDLLRPGDASTFLLTIGGQLATLRPELFQPANLEIVIRQRVGDIAAGGNVIGARVEELHASPFYRVAVRVEQDIQRAAGRASGLRIGRLITTPRLLPMQDLQYLGLLDPARLLHQTQPEARVVVLADALDELRFSPADSDVLRVLRELPADAPTNLKFVISSRPETFLKRLLDRSDVRHLPLTPSDKANRDDLRTYTERFLASGVLEPALAQAATTPSALTPRLLAKAAGNFLYLKSVLHGIQVAQNDPSRRKLLGRLLRVEELPGDLDALYAYFLAAIVESAEHRFGEAAWRRYLTPLLGALSVAAEPVTDKQLTHFAQLKLADVRDLLRELQQFVGRVEEDPRGYRIFHGSFAEFVTDSERNGDYWVDPHAAHRRIVEHFRSHCAGDWPRIVPDGYVREHLAAHMAAADDRASLYALISRSWMEAKLSVTGSHWGFAQDTTVAMEMAGGEQPPNLPKLVRAALITTTLGILATTVPPSVLRVLAKAGETGRAAEYAALVQDARQQSEAYQHISEALVARGTLDQAAAVAERIGQPWRQALARSRICEGAGDRAGADRALDQAITAAADDAPNRSAEVLREVGRLLAESGDAARLARRLDRLHGSPLATALLDAFVSQLVQQADRAGLRWLLELIPARPHDELRAATLRTLAPHLRLIGDSTTMQRALDTAERIVEQAHRASALGALARAATVESDRAGIDRIAAAAERITARWPKLLLLGELSRATALLGDHRRASLIAGEVGDAIAAIPEDDLWDRVALWNRVAVLSRAAEMLALVGEQQQAREVIEQALLTAHRTRFQPMADALNVIVGTMARAGRVDQAIALMQYGVTSTHRTVLLGEIAGTVALAGDSDRAAELAERAAIAARALDDAAERASILIRLAPVQAAVSGRERAFGLLDEAHAALDEIDDTAARAQILGGLALAWSAAGEHRRARNAFTAAVAAAETIDDPQTHLALLGELLAAASDSGLDRPQELDVDRIFELAQAAHLPGPAAHRVAVGLARAGATARAVTVARALADDKAKADGLGSILLVARGLEPGAAREAIAQVRAVAGELRDRGHRSILLDHVVGALATIGAYDEAVALAQEIEDPLMPPQSLAVVAAVAAENGHQNQARGAAALAGEALNRLDGHAAARARALDHLAYASAAVGDRRRAEELAQEALSAVSQVEEPQDSLPRLAQMADTLVWLGMGEQAADAAQQLLQKMTLNARVAYLLAPVVRAWALLGDVTRAPEVVDPMIGSPAPLDELFEPLAEAMRFDEALALVQRLGPRMTSSTALVVIAQALLHPTRGVDVAPVADRILRIADAEAFWAGPELLAVLSHALALAGEADEAVAIADRALERLREPLLSYADERAFRHLLQTYGQLRVLSNRVERLVSAVNWYDPVKHKATAAAIIAQGFLDDDDRHNALRTIAPILIPQEIDDDVEAYEQAQALSALSVAASRTGRTRLALDLAQCAWTAASAIEYYEGQLGGVADKERALAGATRAFVRADDYDTALESLQVILSPLNRMAILWDVARGAARTSARSPMGAAAAQADALVAEKRDPHISTAFLRCGAALVLVAAGDTRGALRHVDSVLALEQHFENSANKALVWSLVVEALVGAHEVGRAAEVAERGIAFARAHAHREERLWALLGCARGLSVLGHQERAADIVREAMQTWEAVEKAGDPPGTLYLASMSHFSELFGLSYASRGGGRAPVVLSCAALAFVDADNRPAARAAANRAKAATKAMDKPLSRALALATVARALAAANDQQQAAALLQDALTLAGRISHQALLRVLSIGALAIADDDAGEILEQTGCATLEIASWWPLAPASTSPGDDSGPWKGVISAAGERRFE